MTSGVATAASPPNSRTKSPSSTRTAGASATPTPRRPTASRRSSPPTRPPASTRRHRRHRAVPGAGRGNLRAADATVDTVDRFQGRARRSSSSPSSPPRRSTARSSRITGVSTSHSRGRRRRSSSSATATRWRPTRCTVGWSSGRGADYASASPRRLSAALQRVR